MQEEETLESIFYGNELESTARRRSNFSHSDGTSLAPLEIALSSATLSLRNMLMVTKPTASWLRTETLGINDTSRRLRLRSETRANFNNTAKV